MHIAVCLLLLFIVQFCQFLSVSVITDTLFTLLRKLREIAERTDESTLNNPNSQTDNATPRLTRNAPKYHYYHSLGVSSYYNHFA